MKDAWTFGFKSLTASLTFILHGLMPCAFQHKGGEIIEELHKEITLKKASVFTNATIVEEQANENMTIS